VWIRHGRKVFDADLPIYTALFDEADERFRDELLLAAQPLMAGLAPAAVRRQGELHQCLCRHLVTGNGRGVRGMVRLMTPPRTFRRVLSGFRLLPMRDRLDLGRVGVRQVGRGFSDAVRNRFSASVEQVAEPGPVR
jgi:hypothetical protein